MCYPLFKENKYSKWYFSIIAFAQDREIETDIDYEYHHIIPKSLGGTNKKENLVYLTIREHFVCHLLLVKMVIDLSHKKSMSYALIGMKRSRTGARKVITSREFELARKIAKKYISGENNHFYRKGDLFEGEKNPMYRKPCYYKMTEEEKKRWKDNISAGIKGENNPFYGKTHSEKTRFNLCLKRSKPIRVFFFDGSSVVFCQYKYLGYHLGKSGALGGNLVKEKNKHLHKKYNIKRIEWL